MTLRERIDDAVYRANTVDGYESVVEEIMAAIAEAVAAERERCARIVEQWEEERDGSCTLYERIRAAPKGEDGP
jgi:hypothetical protein